eukprot:331003_1
MNSDIGWYIGVGLGIGSSIVSNVGVNVQRLAHSNREEELKSSQTKLVSPMRYNYDVELDAYSETSPLENTKRVKRKRKYSNGSIITTVSMTSVAEIKQQKSYLLDIKWIFGLFLQIIGAFMDFTALGFAPASVVAPLGSLTLVTNVCLAPLLHKEKPSKKILCSTLLIVVGTIVTVIFSPREDGVSSTQEVFELFKETEFDVYLTLVLLLLVGNFIIVEYMKYIKKHRNEDYNCGFYHKLHRFSIASMSGTMGAQNVFFAKCISTLIVFSLADDGKVLTSYWQTYLILIALLGTIYFQLKWLNSGLMQFSALYIVPIFQSFWITVSVIGGLLVYQEYDDMSMSDKFIFPIGVIATICGVAFLTSQQNPDDI